MGLSFTLALIKHLFCQELVNFANSIDAVTAKTYTSTYLIKFYILLQSIIYAKPPRNSFETLYIV